ncbi:acyl-CoA dehydrogenase [Tomitella fengzijianii]|uniref:Acyl-CoA dehydrogenase n=1 Tax=Tomitella fengzijianii TaxID=2597660 RepID=A0A516WZE6_9ACTN|nr:acyl-CoA dehydrogenase [Tomitella fengzijianii]QDQ96127.1 acyl-CoA dehydrogenase [Tomitella fengzijianii]
MALALDDDRKALAESVAAFAARAGGPAEARADFARFAAGGRPSVWEGLCAQGLHAIHIPEAYGGDGAGIAELAVVIEQLGRALLPGPFLPTAYAGAVLAFAAAPSDAADRALRALAGGATAAVCAGGSLTARAVDGGWEIDGASEPSLGLPGADVVLLRAAEGNGHRWFRVTPPAGAVEAAKGVDLTRAIGTLTLDGHRVAGADAVPGVDDGDAEWARAVLFAAEASGIATWCLDTAVDHVRTREQFGRPVGSFQAVQHKAAMMLVRSEIACAAAWDAARAADQDSGQRAITAAQAAVASLGGAVDNALEGIALLGGVGYTWEHDAHLYQRRAVSIAALAGSTDRWADRLGELTLADAERDFTFVGPDALPELRARVGAVLDATPGVRRVDRDSVRWGSARGDAARTALADAGLVAPHFPEPYGLGAGPEEQAVIAQEFAARGLSQPSMIIGEWVLPTLLEHGSEVQRKRFLGPSLRGEIVWCQLFSEPGAGSDLAGLSTAARRTEGGWLLRGQKVWNSYAHEADWGVCLARTDPSAPKHRGISYFLVDMRSPGIEVRPLRQATGRAEFNEVFLDDVFVPDECLVGEPGEGWRLATMTLANERLRMGGAQGHGSSRRIRGIVAAGEHDCARADAVHALGLATSRELALNAMNLRGVLARVAGRSPGAEISVAKLYSAIAQRDGSRDLMRLLGPRAAVHDHPPGAVPDDALDDHATDHLGLPAILFGGGTIEIQLNVIARRVLRLPQ